MSAIISFSGENHFLSNFYPSPIIVNGSEYDARLMEEFEFPTLEHAYQASKCTFGTDMWNKVAFASTPGQAKRFANEVTPSKYFLSIRNDIMRDLLRQKFEYGSVCAWLLMGTGLRTELIEGNTWGDTYWGRVLNEKGFPGEGQNILGRMLMNRRATLFSEFHERECEFTPVGKALLAIGAENKLARLLEERIAEARKLVGLEA